MYQGEVTDSQSPMPERADAPLSVELKRVARLLIAERGVRSVTVREIATAARQRNLGIVAYYFGTKDKLIREILIDGAERIEARRGEYLAALEAKRGPKNVREAVAAIVLPAAAFSDEDRLYGSGFNRFLLQLSLSDSRLIDETLAGRGNQNYQRCLSHLRKLLPHLTRTQQNRRFVFLGSYVSGLLAARETVLADAGGAHPTWRSPETLAEIVATASAALEAEA